ncbi:PRC-barrel domain-containing protein [Alkalinema sp. FACHB-956]|uniref:PRC-barrel domain-containing protein n=1 Tax=Alkalinema sp. FACHB-956 TaxID=2692768 RepID=UPI001681D755|nr:PRC-barrel domain-containing protein [Alkalinema sp. FACHB-956]MBD2329462.1 PRC-barrel domain-containing protein [Alkalinema sp. FACHB-956]
MSAEFRQRTDLLGTQVITRDTGKKLGVVSQLWVDIDSQEVVALSLRPSLFYGTPQPMMLSSIRQIGDVILVDDENVIEDIDVEQFNSLINCEVITETGEVLGKVRGYKFDIDNGKLESLTIASLGFPLIPDQVVSTFELGVTEIVSSGPDRLIVYEGAEERLNQMTVGVLERLGLGKAPWEKDELYAPPSPVRIENQLPSGQRVPLEAPPLRRPQVESVEETWDEDNWERQPEPLELRQPPQARQQARYLENEPADNWTNATTRDRYDEPYNEDDDADDYEDVEFAEVVEEVVDVTPVVEVQPTDAAKAAIVEPEATIADASTPEEASAEDPWTDPEATEYKPQALNIPDKVKQPEYEE